MTAAIKKWCVPSEIVLHSLVSDTASAVETNGIDWGKDGFFRGVDGVFGHWVHTMIVLPEPSHITLALRYNFILWGSLYLHITYTTPYIWNPITPEGTPNIHNSHGAKLAEQCSALVRRWKSRIRKNAGRLSASVRGDKIMCSMGAWFYLFGVWRVDPVVEYRPRLYSPCTSRWCGNCRTPWRSTERTERRIE